MQSEKISGIAIMFRSYTLFSFFFQNIRRKIGNLRRAFKELMTRNQKLPPHVQITTDVSFFFSHFCVDRNIINRCKVNCKIFQSCLHEICGKESSPQCFFNLLSEGLRAFVTFRNSKLIPTSSRNRKLRWITK